MIFWGGNSAVSGGRGSQTANCYIVSNAGSYSFPTVKGNSTQSVGNVSRAEVLWESFGTSIAPSKGDIIQSVSYVAGSGSSAGTITFSTPSALRNGNAVIAAKDAGGNILWSWHIWVCSGYNPATTAQMYYNNAGKMMDRNLGRPPTRPGMSVPSACSISGAGKTRSSPAAVSRQIPRRNPRSALGRLPFLRTAAPGRLLMP